MTYINMSIEKFGPAEQISGYKITSEKMNFGGFDDIYDKQNKLIADIYDFLNKSKIDITLEDIYDKIDALGIDFSVINSFQIIDGILVCYSKNGNSSFYNLLYKNEKVANQTIKTLKEQKNTVTSKAKTELKETKVSIDKESLMGGAIVLSYSATMRAGNFFIDSVVVKRINGSQEKITLSEGGINSGNKTELKTEVFKLLEQKGIIYNSANDAFYRVEDIKVSSSGVESEIKNLDYERYKKLMKESGQGFLTEAEFNKAKNGVLKDLKLSGVKTDIKTIQSLIGKWGFGGMIMESIFLPVFFKEFHSNTSDLASMGKSLSEMALFMSGAKLGGKIPGNIFTKSILSLGGGIGSIILGEEIGENIELNKKFWKAFPDREDYWYKNGLSDGKSVIAHILTFGPVNGIFDKLGFDFKIPWTPIEFIKTNVDLSTDPLSYMQSDIGRDVTFWNNRVETFGNKLSVDIYNLLVNYKNGTGDFRVSSMVGMDERFIEFASFGKLKPQIELSEFEKQKRKDELFKEKLSGLLNGTGDKGGFDSVKKDLYEAIINISKNNSSNINPESITFLVENNVSKMKIDEHFIKQKTEYTEKQRKNIERLLGLSQESGDLGGLMFSLQFASITTDTETKNFLVKLYKRIVNKERMLDSDIIEQDYENGTYTTKPSDDKKMFTKLIDGKNGPIFLQFLDYVIEYKGQLDFVGNLKSNGYAVKWNLF